MSHRILHKINKLVDVRSRRKEESGQSLLCDATKTKEQEDPDLSTTSHTEKMDFSGSELGYEYDPVYLNSQFDSLRIPANNHLNKLKDIMSKGDIEHSIDIATNDAIKGEETKAVSTSSHVTKKQVQSCTSRYVRAKARQSIGSKELINTISTIVSNPIPQKRERRNSLGYNCNHVARRCSNADNNILAYKRERRSSLGHGDYRPQSIESARPRTRRERRASLGNASGRVNPSTSTTERPYISRNDPRNSFILLEMGMTSATVDSKRLSSGGNDRFNFENKAVLDGRDRNETI